MSVQIENLDEEVKLEDVLDRLDKENNQDPEENLNLLDDFGENISLEDPFIDDTDKIM